MIDKPCGLFIMRIKSILVYYLRGVIQGLVSRFKRVLP